MGVGIIRVTGQASSEMHETWIRIRAMQVLLVPFRFYYELHRNFHRNFLARALISTQDSGSHFKPFAEQPNQFSPKHSCKTSELIPTTQPGAFWGPD
jgi:hypothetical protein